jgi:RNA polymerase sigma-70 factor (ECF subfamily)
MNPDAESIWNEFSVQLDRFVRARVGDPDTARDLVQDVFLKLQRRIEQFRDPDKLKGWLFLVARNAIIDHYRTRKNAVELTESLPADWSEHANEEQELKSVFHRLLHRLPEPYREALVLTEFEGLTQEALAKRLGISLSGAKSRVQRGREQLKELLLDYCHREFGRLPGAQPCPKGLLPAMPDSRRGTVQAQRNSRGGTRRKPR